MSPCFAKKKRRFKKEVIEKESFIDSTHGFISDTWSGLNNNLDLFFSNETSKKKKNKGHISAYYGVEKTEGEKITENFDIKVRIDLQRTIKKLKLVVEKERDDILEATRVRHMGGKSGEDLGGKDYVAGVSYFLFESNFFKTHLHTGLKILMPLDPFMKWDLNKIFTFNSFNISITQKFVLYRQAGASEVTGLLFSAKLSSSYLLNQSNYMSWSDESDEFNLRNSLTLHQKLSDRRRMNYIIGANAQFSPTFYYESYDISMGLWQDLYGKWLFSGIAMGVKFAKEDDFSPTGFVQGRLEIHFR